MIGRPTCDSCHIHVTDTFVRYRFGGGEESDVILCDVCRRLLKLGLIKDLWDLEGYAIKPGPDMSEGRI